MSTYARSSPPAPMVPPELGDRIAGARAIAILGMIYVHVPGAEEMIAAGGASGVGAQFLVDGIGRASAALLAIVSGWLVATALLGKRVTAGALIARRAGTSLRPMVFWASVTVLLYCLVSLVRPTFLSVPFENGFALTMRFLDTVFFITPSDIGPTVHLSFLRDLFVCVVLAWPLMRLLRCSPGLTLSVLAALYLSQIQIYLVLRPLVLFCFAIGMALSLYRIRLDALDRWLPIWVLAGCVATASIVLARAGLASVDGVVAPLAVPLLPGWRIDLLESVLYPLTRLCWTLVLWCATAHLVARPIAGFLRRQSPWIFTAFCSHFLSLTVLWFVLIMPLSARLPDPVVSAMLFVWFLIAPLLAFGVAYLLMRVIATASPTLGVLSGVPAAYSLIDREVKARTAAHAGATRAGGASDNGVPAILAGGEATLALAGDPGNPGTPAARSAHARERRVAG